MKEIKITTEKIKMPKGFLSKGKSNFNASSTITACPLCDWRCERKGSKLFLRKLILCHLKINHNIIMTMDEMDKNAETHNHKYFMGHSNKLHKKVDEVMKSIKN